MMPMYRNFDELTSIAQDFFSEAPQEVIFCRSLSTWRQMKEQSGHVPLSERSQSKQHHSSWLQACQKTYMERKFSFGNNQPI